MRVLTVIGTRPEAIKLAPVVQRLALEEGVQSYLCLTGQHRDIVNPILKLFGLSADFDLRVMRKGQDLTDITQRILLGMRELFSKHSFDLVVVHGDTTSGFAAALSAFYAHIPVAHVEAGLRTGSLDAPWPEEGNRSLIGRLARLHFAPTEQARQNLLREGISDQAIFVTGNTVVDALYRIRDQVDQHRGLRLRMARRYPFLKDGSKMILVTGHRRENFGDGLKQICDAIKRLARRDDVQVVYPVHPNPLVRDPVHRLLGDEPNIFLVEPLDYPDFVYLMDRCYFVLTDSGGVQEEAPCMGRPVLVMREKTERPEGLRAGVTRLVGTDTNLIVRESEKLLSSPKIYQAMCKAPTLYGSGDAADQIVSIMVKHLHLVSLASGQLVS
ncbi:MAG: non-hydrolyzing UDP-N-acetylglucosamine 2-epimerase [Litorivicinaceae bacterium]